MILAIGSMVKTAIEVSDLFKKNENINIGVVNCRYIKPLDWDFLNEIFQKYDKIYTIEEGSVLGGFGSSVLEYLSDTKYKNIQIKNFGIPDNFIDHGKREELLDLVNLSSEKIYERIKND